MDEAFIDTLVACAGDAGAFIRDITRFYFDFYERINGERRCPIHDSSAVACLLYPELYTRVSGPVRVVTTGIATGQTIIGEQPDSYAIDAWRDRPSCRVCSDVDADGVRQRYLEILASATR
jgi:inosine-uridine nucleoside N-ribohydrolase